MNPPAAGDQDRARHHALLLSLNGFYNETLRRRNALPRTVVLRQSSAMCLDHLPDDRPWPQQGRERLIIPAPVAIVGTGQSTGEHEALARLSPDTVMMMGDNPALPRMPEAPTLLDFFPPPADRHHRAPPDGLGETRDGRRPG